MGFPAAVPLCMETTVYIQNPNAPLFGTWTFGSEGRFVVSYIGSILRKQAGRLIFTLIVIVIAIVMVIVIVLIIVIKLRALNPAVPHPLHATSL